MLLLIAAAHAQCPSDVTIAGDLTCSSDISDGIDHTADSYLGGDCDDGACYTCGDPYTEEAQVAPEAVYTFHCQQTGLVALRITDLPCDLDMYVLDSSCDPYAGCLYGSTSPYDEDDAVDFECTAGETHYIVIEAYGTNHLENASGPCTDDGTADGALYSPTYTLSFDVSASTGCAEDCDDEEDNDFDGDKDCDDEDCFSEPLCCDRDGDGVFDVDCGGEDCDDDDSSSHAGAEEIADGRDNDCDGVVDNGTDAYDDDGDGFTEEEGDCDDDDASIHPDAEEIPDDGIDQDCDGEDAVTEGMDDSGTPSDGHGGVIPGGGDDKQDACSCAAGPAAAPVLLLPVLIALRRRR
jgi:uncharacterized protein (TIGR03382 family)